MATQQSGETDVDRDPTIVAGQSGAVGFAGLVTGDPAPRAEIGGGSDERVLLVNTDGASDPPFDNRPVVVRPEM
ncbi:hypothetical protein AAFG07_31290 [Bradyrhizobium sp. B097]|uniref:hypothetical protein n=1 Tax=Bradyrhizobium sp. B097 TaxID=3140244 RepID=UPI0031845F14